MSQSTQCSYIQKHLIQYLYAECLRYFQNTLHIFNFCFLISSSVQMYEECMNHRCTWEIPDLLYRPVFMASSAMGLRVFADHARKTNAPVIFARLAAFYACSSSCSYRSRCSDIHTSQTTIILITGKTRRPLIWAPCRNQGGAGSGVSRIYLCMNPH